MRSIGKVRIKKLYKIIEKAVKENTSFSGEIDYSKAREEIKAKVPLNWYDTWEMAYQEIENIIDDELTEYSMKSKFGR